MFIVNNYDSIIRALETTISAITIEKVTLKEKFFRQEAERNYLPDLGSDEIKSETSASKHIANSFRLWSTRMDISVGDANVIMNVLGSLEKIITADENCLNDVPVDSSIKSKIMQFFGNLSSNTLNDPLHQNKSNVNSFIPHHAETPNIEHDVRMSSIRKSTYFPRSNETHKFRHQNNLDSSRRQYSSQYDQFRNHGQDQWNQFNQYSNHSNHTQTDDQLSQHRSTRFTNIPNEQEYLYHQSNSNANSVRRPENLSQYQYEPQGSHQYVNYSSQSTSNAFQDRARASDFDYSNDSRRVYHDHGHNFTNTHQPMSSNTYNSRGPTRMLQSANRRNIGMNSMHFQSFQNQNPNWSQSQNYHYQVDWNGSNEFCNNQMYNDYMR